MRCPEHGGDAPADGAAADSWIHPDDLIDDRALTSLDQDEFRLGDVVEEVASLCESTQLPATLALYGSWGSGKSSLANLLEGWFEKDRKVAFARFDAFKYAEVPLRRHFLSQVAEAFKVKDDTFAEGLYTSSRDVRLHIPLRKWKVLFLMVVISVLVTTFFAAMAAFAVALVSKGALWADFTKALQAGVPGVVLATPIVATAVAFAGKTLTADVATEAPSSEEQFEELFKTLVDKALKKTKSERLVIFIDELDRCSPPQVVTALETLRTFLEVSPCVFVVAADRQALEHALTEAARQATPLDSANPYYSAGSAYLDKIFQYQLQLPPILPRRLSRYALDLIKDRMGVWARVSNRPELVSVLIPTHVRSPRRVKALLNSFALLYRLALRRAAEGSIDAGVAQRAAEVAKLVCLRIEFPLFAADLQLYSRLPEVVLLLHRDSQADTSDFHGLSAEAKERALSYARESLPVGEVIAQPKTAPTPAADYESEAPTTKDVEASQAKQLIRYLEKTRAVRSPGSDLIYLEGSGAAFGLASELAQQLEEDAVDGEAQAVVDAVEVLDEPEQHKAYRLLARVVVEAVGIEATNVARSLFAAISVRVGDLTPVADDLLNALVTHSSGYELEADDLIGALVLALSHDGAAAQEMRRRVVARDEFVDDDRLALVALKNADKLWSHRARLSEALAALLERGKASEAEQMLSAALSEDEVDELVAVVPAEDDDVIEGLRDFIDSAQSSGRREIARRGLKRLLDSDETAAADAVGTLIESFAPVTDGKIAAPIVNKARNRAVSEWPTWLGTLDAETVRGFDNIDPVLDHYVKRLWEARTSPPSGIPVDDDAFVGAARAIGRLRPGVRAEDEDQLRLVQSLPVVAVASAVAPRASNYGDLWKLADAGALDANEVAADVLADLERTLGAPQVPQAPQPMADHVVTAAPRALEQASAPEIDAFVAALDASEAWMPPPRAAILRVRAACAVRANRLDAAAPPDEALQAVLEDDSDAAIAAAARWIRVFTPEPVELYRLLTPRLGSGQRLPDATRAALNDVAAAWSREQKADLLDSIGERYVDGEIDDSVVRTFGLADADPERASRTLVQLYGTTSNNDSRSRVLDLWRLVNPGGEHAQRLLINDIYLPLLKEGKGALKIALDHFSLVRDAPSAALKDKVKSGIKSAAAATDQATRADRLMKDVGWITGKRKWWRF